MGFLVFLIQKLMPFLPDDATTITLHGTLGGASHVPSTLAV